MVTVVSAANGPNIVYTSGRALVWGVRESHTEETAVGLSMKAEKE